MEKSISPTQNGKEHFIISPSQNGKNHFTISTQKTELPEENVNGNVPYDPEPDPQLSDLSSKKKKYKKKKKYHKNMKDEFVRPIIE